MENMVNCELWNRPHERSWPYLYHLRSPFHCSVAVRARAPGGFSSHRVHAGDRTALERDGFLSLGNLLERRLSTAATAFLPRFP
eukprot:scaffold87903_cov30-Tisochrysis_lutea.AAC.1